MQRRQSVGHLAVHVAKRQHVVEAVLLLSAVAFENTGLSIAHAIATELGAIKEVAAHSLHGEHAAYGTMVQVLAEGRSDEEREEFFAFTDSIAFPACLAALGYAGDIEAGIAALAQATAGSAHMVNQKRPVSAD